MEIPKVVESSAFHELSFISGAELTMRCVRLAAVYPTSTLFLGRKCRNNAVTYMDVRSIPGVRHRDVDEKASVHEP